MNINSFLNFYYLNNGISVTPEVSGVKVSVEIPHVVPEGSLSQDLDLYTYFGFIYKTGTF